MTRNAEPNEGKSPARTFPSTGGGRVKVLFLENSVVLRTALKELFKQDAALEVCTCPAALDLAMLNIARNLPEVVVVDADQEWKDVCALVGSIRASHPRVGLVVMGSDQPVQRELAGKARAIGITECWLKSDRFRNANGEVRQYLVDRTMTFLGRKPEKEVSKNVANSSEQVAVKSRIVTTKAKKTVIVIGVSTGGPDALSTLLPLLPTEINVPILIVQHTLASFTSLLVERLQKRTSRAVIEAWDGMVLSNQQIVVAPGNRHLQLALKNRQVVTVLDEGPPENSCRPAVDPLFRSAAQIYGTQALGIILTGMGQDGLAGCRALKQAGGFVVAQDEASSTVWGMPGQVAQAGLADRVMDLKDIPGEIMRQVRTTANTRSEV